MSDLREALKPCPLCSSTDLVLGTSYVDDNAKEPAVGCGDCGCRATLKAWNTRATLAQPEAVEPVIIARAADAMVERVMYAAPPLAPDERMRSHLAHLQEIIGDLQSLCGEFGCLGGQNRIEFLRSKILDGERMRRALEEATVSSCGPDITIQCNNYAVKGVILKALSRADEGKESEGEICCYCDAEIGRNSSCQVCGMEQPSDPTPPDATAQREAFARIIDPDTYHAYDIHKRAGTVAENGKPWADVVCGKDIAAALAKADKLILALQTRAGG